MESRNRKVVVERGLALLVHSGMPLRYWVYAFKIPVFILNRCPSKNVKGNIPMHFCIISSLI